MKHAVLILAHKNVEQLSRLAGRLKNENVDVFVHLDKKWDISEEEIQKLRKDANVKICQKRVSCFLDRWSLVEATYELIKTAQEFGGGTIITVC